MPADALQTHWRLAELRQAGVAATAAADGARLAHAAKSRYAVVSSIWDALDMASLILTVVGPDRPGLVRALSEAVAGCGGSWQESRMARLAGQFAGIVLVEAPESLADDLRALEAHGLRVAVQNAASGPAEQIATQPRLALEVVGNDRPGIVRDVAQILASSGVNIEELTTGVASGSFSGETLFRATALLRAPNAAAADAVRAALECLGNDLMVDIQPAADS